MLWFTFRNSDSVDSNSVWSKNLHFKHPSNSEKVVQDHFWPSTHLNSLAIGSAFINVITYFNVVQVRDFSPFLKNMYLFYESFIIYYLCNRLYKFTFPFRKRENHTSGCELQWILTRKYRKKYLSVSFSSWLVTVPNYLWFPHFRVELIGSHNLRTVIKTERLGKIKDNQMCLFSSLMKFKLELLKFILNCQG